MLKQKYILFVYLIISKIHLQTQYARMFTFLSKLLFKTKQNTLTNTHTHSSMQTKKGIRLIFIPVHKHNKFPVYS